MATSSVLSTFAATAITLQLLLSPASASPHMKYIDAICDRAHDQAFCVKTLTTNPPTAAPIGLVRRSQLFVCIFFFLVFKSTKQKILYMKKLKCFFLG